MQFDLVRRAWVMLQDQPVRVLLAIGL